jgi:hypothetical protein
MKDLTSTEIYNLLNDTKKVKPTSALGPNVTLSTPKETTYTLTASEMKTHIELHSKFQAKIEAKEMFNAWKKDYLASFNLDSSFTPISEKAPIYKQKKRDTFTADEVLNQESNSKMRLVYETLLSCGGALDRHEIQVRVEDIIGREISMGTIGGRMGDLLESNLITEVGTHIGKFGRSLKVYSATVNTSKVEA